MDRMKVGVIGATGMVGQNYIRLLEGHPWFEVSYVAASPRSAGKTFAEAVAGRWHMPGEIPEAAAKLIVGDARDIDLAKRNCQFVFSAVELSKDEIRTVEAEYAAKGLPVVSNNSAHRHTADVPMLIPEINADHIAIIDTQRKNRGWDKGLIAVKPNCSLQSYLTPIHALRQAGYAVNRMVITTLQALSGAGYPGPSAMDLIDNVVPYIGGEEEKSEQEPLKILGRIENGAFVEDDSIKISAHCNRVPSLDGHLACVSVGFAGKKPSLQEIERIWTAFRSVPQELGLPFAPRQPIVVRHEPDRPQPRKDRNAERGMAVVVGRLRECNVFDFRFAGLSHNTVRGAAGGGILNAELLKARGYIE
ncbi:MAG: Aspartate-semialdehyde dehydrogenase 2 [candidate division BRC1 bacterium ADurb.BinA364]|nr:MAG: Aspartate-semialdehyde dehydrogenase 2 [candidate division BRC1 bacterium ADurb.BinA364]